MCGLLRIIRARASCCEPVIITTGCEFPEVSEREAGLVVEAGEMSIAGAMNRLLTDADLRRKMGL